MNHITNHEMNDVVFFVHGQHVVKGVIEELIVHYTQKETIVKYIIRPYGLKDYVTIEDDKIYLAIQKAKDCVVDELKATYTKRNLINNYKTACKRNKEKFNEQMKNFNECLPQAIENIESVTEQGYDDLEKAYQEKKKTEETTEDMTEPKSLT